MRLPWFDKRSSWARIGGLDTFAALLGSVLLPCLHLQAQTDPQSRKVQAGGQEPLRSALATHVDKAPKLDGTIDDPLWNQASPIVNFLQREPYEGQTPSEQTEVRVLYTKHEVYFGITCFDSNPQGVVATELRRDVSQELDDYFEIIIDSAHDRRNAYVFQVNPLRVSDSTLCGQSSESTEGAFT